MISTPTKIVAQNAVNMNSEIFTLLVGTPLARDDYAGCGWC